MSTNWALVLKVTCIQNYLDIVIFISIPFHNVTYNYFFKNVIISKNKNVKLKLNGCRFEGHFQLKQ